MGSEGKPHEEPRAMFVCPECKQPVLSVVVSRRKVLGAWVPVWGPGPCRNPQCPRNAEYAKDRAADPQRHQEQAG